MPDFGQENVIQHAVEAFAETVSLKVKQLRRYIPKQRALTNQDLTGAYIEELVRGFVRGWIGQQELLHGTFYYQKHIDSGQKPLQIDGIVYDPTRGPAILREGDFVIVHPAFCSGVVEIKMTIPSVQNFLERLWEVHAKYLSHLPSTHVMGVVIADQDPVKASEIKTKDGRTLQAYNHFTIPLCPIFILFKETPDGEYEPHYPAIEGMIRAMHSNLVVTTNHM
jgi:hypothetical protein